MTDNPIFPEQLIKSGLDDEDDASYTLATRIAKTIVLIQEANLNVSIPNSAIKYAENIFDEWFNDVSSVARYSSDPLYLIDRIGREVNLDDGDLDWTQGIGIKELGEKYEEIMDEMDPSFGIDFPTVGADGLFGELWKAQLTTYPLSGHYNRFLPMKISLRVLLNMIVTSETYGGDDYIGEREKIYIEDFREKALETATYAKKYFKKIDLRNQFDVGEKITVGFPDDVNDDSNAKKSVERFVSQFVGSIRKKGKGSLCEMGFILVDDDGVVEMTREGLYYALRTNPIIDRTPEGVKGISMSHDEKGFMVNHIRKHLAEEWKLMEIIARQIYEGNLNPKMLDNFLETEYEWSSSKSNQARNGCISRMVEIGFVTRQKKGREVYYQLTEWAERLLIDSFFGKLLL